MDAENQRARAEGREHFDREGRLVVPVARSLDPTPKREGWKPWWVNIVLSRDPQKWVTYRREEV